MKRIIYHWTAGSYIPNKTDILHYHYIIDNKGKIHEGNFKPEDNKICTKNKYAAHTGGGNTGSIGIAFAGMYGFVNRYNIGNYPLTKKQCEVGFELGARLVKKYNLKLDEKLTIQTHYGFGQRHKNSTSYSKIDIIYLPPYPNVEAIKIEDFIRNKVRWYVNKEEWKIWEQINWYSF